MHKSWTKIELLVVLSCLYLTLEASAEVQGMLRVKDSETREVKDLCGLWNFRADMSNDRKAGFRESWFSKPLSKSGATIPMPVPSSYNDITQDRTLRDFIGWVWYDREFFVPHSWNDLNKTRVVLRFESAHYYSIVWVNGKKVVEHEGGHLPFEVEITTDLAYNGKVNWITAAVNNTLTPTTLPPGTIEYLTGGDGYPPGYFVQKYKFDFFNYAGIHRPVKLYTTSIAYLSDITITTSYDQTSQLAVVQFDCQVGAPDTVPENEITMKYDLLDKDNYVVATYSGADMFKGQFTIKNPILWWPVGMSNITAYLYTLKVITSVPSRDLLDIYRIPVGIRTVKVEKRKFLINDKPFYFKGFGKHEDSDIRGKGLDYALIAKDFNLMNWFGGNAFRTSHYPYAEEIMDMADEQGIVVVDESPGVGIDADNFGLTLLNHHLNVMKELITRDKNRPAVVMWSLANEPRTDVPKATAYFEPIFKLTRELDPTRPVTYVTQFEAWNDKVSQFSDVILCNHYYAWYQDYGHTELISAQLEKGLRDWFNKFQKPVLQSEYGANTVAGMHADPPAMFTEEYQVETLQQYFPVFDKLRKEFFVGEMIWNFADFMTAQGISRVVGDKEGILTRQRQPKAAALIIRKRYRNITLEQTPSGTGDDLSDALIKFESRASPVNSIPSQALNSLRRK